MQSNEHTSKQFDAELATICTNVLEMGDLVKSQVSDAINSLVRGDVALTTRVIDCDHRVKAMEVKIDEVCTKVIVRRQPTANDLRFVMTVIKTITDLERIGDEAKRIARMAQILSLSKSISTPRYNEVKFAAEIALGMLCKSLDAFARLDVNLAAQVVREDDQVDEKFRSILRNLVIFMIEDPRIISTALEVLFVAKAIERIGDHAQNVAEYVIYMVKGSNVRHVTVDEIEHEVQRQHDTGHHYRLDLPVQE